MDALLVSIIIVCAMIYFVVYFRKKQLAKKCGDCSSSSCSSCPIVTDSHLQQHLRARQHNKN